jgi:hypothetical protein
MIPPIGHQGKPLLLGLYLRGAHKPAQRAIQNGPSFGEKSWGRSQGGTMPRIGMTQMWVRNQPMPIKFWFREWSRGRGRDLRIGQAAVGILRWRD